MRSSAGWLLMSLFVVGCAPGVGDEADESGEEVVEEADDALRAQNAVHPNAVHPNAVHPNAVHPNALAAVALASSTLSSSVMDALRDPGQAGDLSREHVRYLVSCAFNSTQSFSFSWTDSQSVVHDETYWGSVALAPGWATSTTGITETEQRWITACMASRVNYYATTVEISMRGDHASLAADAPERTAFPAREGAFWGNLFATTPTISACYDADNVGNSRSHLRECAAGHLDGETTIECGIIDIAGDCSSLCTAPGQAGDGFPSCSSGGEIITTFLPD